MAGFSLFARQQAPQIVIVLVAILWGVGGVAVLYLLFPTGWSSSCRRLDAARCSPSSLSVRVWLSWPGIWLFQYLRTLILSFQNDISTTCVGLDNYVFAFTDRVMLEVVSQQPVVDDLWHFVERRPGLADCCAGGSQPV